MPIKNFPFYLSVFYLWKNKRRKYCVSRKLPCSTFSFLKQMCALYIFPFHHCLAFVQCSDYFYMSNWKIYLELCRISFTYPIPSYYQLQIVVLLLLHLCTRWLSFHIWKKIHFLHFRVVLISMTIYFFSVHGMILFFMTK